MAVSHEDVESYVAKMLSNGRLAYAINTLKTIKDEKILGLFYPFFYSVVATLGSYDGLEKLDKSEYQLLIGSLDKFVKHESFETIAVDDGLEYKKYSPASNKQNYFRGSIHSDKTIMKFRFSGVHRVFGYRKGDKFRVLLFERDHSISDHG